MIMLMDICSSPECLTDQMCPELLQTGEERNEDFGFFLGKHMPGRVLDRVTFQTCPNKWLMAGQQVRSYL